MVKDMSWRRTGLKVILLVIKTVSWLLVGAVLLFLLFFLPTINRFRSFYVSEVSAKGELNGAVAAAKARDFAGAAKQAEEAQASFSQAESDLAVIAAKPWMKNFFVYRNQIDDLNYLTKTGEILSRAVESGAVLADRFQQVIYSSPTGNFNNLSDAKKAEFFQLAREGAPELNGIKADLALAQLNLTKIHRVGILLPVFSQINDLDQKLSEADSLLNSAVPVAELSQFFVGSPEPAKFLILLQNNDELRPSGGFLGTYGILDIQNGSLKNFFSEDTYHLDMPVKDTMDFVPPAPLKEYLKVDRWFLRDANWSPDWPTSARQIQTTYDRELVLDKKTPAQFNGVISINPALAADLIDLVGPIEVNKVTYKGDNFQELLQYEVEQSYTKENISSWDRKAVINDIFTELKKRLFALSYQDYPKILALIQKNLAAKNIQIYLNDPAGEDLVKNFGWAGEVKNPDSDYLMIVDANLAAFKSDAVVGKNWTDTLSLSGTSLKSSLHLSYRHDGTKDWRTTKYRTYTRVLVPLGSKLLSINGAASAVDATDDLALNKTIFGFFFTVDTQKSGAVDLTYQLPDRIFSQYQAGNYQLYWQRQSGSRIESASLVVPSGAVHKMDLESGDQSLP